jgi:hypothetical protein
LSGAVADTGGPHPARNSYALAAEQDMCEIGMQAINSQERRESCQSHLFVGLGY